MQPANARQGYRVSKVCRPRLEALEDRSLPATRLTASLVAGVLRVEGTPAGDVILLRENPVTRDVIVLGGTGGPLAIQTPTGPVAAAPFAA